MNQKLSRYCLWALSIFLLVSVASLCAAAQMGNEQSGTAQTVTGCLQKGLETGGFFVVSADGKHWELYPDKSVSLADQVGHTVAVTGSVVKRSATQEEKSQPYEKKEITGKQHSDLQVSSVKTVSDSCSK